MGRWPKINFSQYGICSNMVANSLPEGTTSIIVLSYIKSRPRYSYDRMQLNHIHDLARLPVPPVFIYDI